MIIGIDASRAFSAFWGGPESYSFNLIQSILKVRSQHHFRLYYNPLNCNQNRFDRFIDVQLSKTYDLKPIAFSRLWTQFGLACECLKNPPDVLFVPAHTLPVIRRPSLKTVVTIHDLGAQFLPNYHKRPQKYYLNWATEYALGNATRIVTVSEYTKGDILKRFGVQRAKCKVIYEGYDREVFYPRNQEEIVSVKKKYDLEGDYFLFVGTIQPRKNLVRLIEAFANVVGNQPCLVLAGASGWLNEEIYAAPKKFGVEARVKFLGVVGHEDLPVLMSGCVAFVFPSLFEGFGLSPLEAMACGAPVILSNRTSLPEVGGEAALYVDPQSVGEIARRMDQVLGWSQGERETSSRRAVTQAQKFSWERAAQETLQVLEKAYED